MNEHLKEILKELLRDNLDISVDKDSHSEYVKIKVIFNNEVVASDMFILKYLI